MTCDVCGEPIRVGGPAFMVQSGGALCTPCVEQQAAEAQRARQAAQAAIAAVRQPAPPRHPALRGV